MSKIEEFENKVIVQGMTDEDFTEYVKLLKRVRGNFSKRQHCYTTAIQFSPKHCEQAIKLIRYGLENFEDGWFSTYTSYLFMGHIYEKIKDYPKAYEAYLSAKVSLGTEHPEYTQELSIHLLWMKLHIDSFSYSTELEEYYACYKKTDDYSKAFINNEFKSAVADVVISLYHGNIDEAKQSLNIALKICKPDYIGKLFNILKRHNYRESLNATEESISFIKSLKI